MSNCCQLECRGPAVPTTLSGETSRAGGPGHGITEAWTNRRKRMHNGKNHRTQYQRQLMGRHDHAGAMTLPWSAGLANQVAPWDLEEMLPP